MCVCVLYDGIKALRSFNLVRSIQELLIDSRVKNMSISIVAIPQLRDVKAFICEGGKMRFFKGLRGGLDSPFNASNLLIL